MYVQQEHRSVVGGGIKACDGGVRRSINDDMHVISSFPSFSAMSTYQSRWWSVEEGGNEQHENKRVQWKTRRGALVLHSLASYQYHLTSTIILAEYGVEAGERHNHQQRDHFQKHHLVGSAEYLLSGYNVRRISIIS